MSKAERSPHTALKYEVEVQENGRVELQVPFSTGAQVVVFIVENASESFDDLTTASQSSLDFWDNPLDDEDWNEA